MDERSSLSSIFTASLRAPFRGSRRQPASEASDGQSNADTSRNLYEKRRQQVRRAQKKHREKKENYVLALEEEVQYLRSALHASQLHTGALRDALGSHGVSIPDSTASLQPELNMARVALVGPPGPNSSLQIQKGESNGAPLHNSAAIHAPKANLATQPAYQHVITDDIAHQPTDGIHTSPSNAVSSPKYQTGGNLDGDYNGLEFVLALEHPCLHHTGHPSISEGMEGHTLTLNAAALACAPTSIEPSEAWSMPIASLDRLLELSHTLGLQPGFLTPVQAWDRLKAHPSFPQLTSEKLQQLVVRLSKEVKCRGFGAAMSEKVFDNMLRGLFK